MTDLVTYRLDPQVALITMDDGKVNALSLAMITEVRQALDQAEEDGATVLLSGRPGRFSAGFDLKLLSSGAPEAIDMLTAGFELAERVLAFPTPVVMACTGHTIAMGLFLLLSADYRIGLTGDYKLTANEVAIGLTLPQAAIEICRERLTPATFTRTAILAEVFRPEEAVRVGILDQIVESSDFEAASHGVAGDLAQLDMRAHAATKARARRPALVALRAAIEADDAALRRGR